ncbi:MAG TPA: DUF2489 domain-containing protein, partial [Pseudomonas sp.]|nr:DUF2489 domain-containing protein [Pseudomonas sp.]
MTPINTLLLIAGLLLIVALAGYALHLWRKVWRREQQLAEMQAQQHAALAADLR